jgi:hypothetical protein
MMHSFEIFRSRFRPKLHDGEKLIRLPEWKASSEIDKQERVLACFAELRFVASFFSAQEG